MTPDHPLSEVLRAACARVDAKYLLHGINASPVSALAQPDSSIAGFLAELADKDMTLADWARAKRLPVKTVYDVASGRLVGRRGIARKVARAMRIAVPAMHAAAEGVAA